MDVGFLSCRAHVLFDLDFAFVPVVRLDNYGHCIHIGLADTGCAYTLHHLANGIRKSPFGESKVRLSYEKRSVLSLLIALAVVAAVVASCAGPIWWTEASERRFLLKHVDHRAVGTACLDLLTKREYQTLMGQYPSGDDPRLPPAIREVKAFWLSVHTNQVLIMKTGRHCHMGFIFRPNDSDSNLYDLVFREERDLEHGICLYSVRKG